MHVESVYCSAGCVHKGEQFAVLVRTVANETRVASWRRLPNSTRVEAPLGLLFFARVLLVSAVWSLCVPKAQVELSSDGST